MIIHNMQMRAQEEKVLMTKSIAFAKIVKNHGK